MLQSVDKAEYVKFFVVVLVIVVGIGSLLLDFEVSFVG